MIRPEKISLVEFITLESEVNNILSILYSDGDIEIEESGSLVVEEYVKPYNISDALDSAEALKVKSDMIVEILGAKYSLPLPSGFDPLFADSNAEKIIQLYDELVNASNRHSQMKSAYSDNELISDYISWLETETIDISECNNYMHTDFISGMIDESDFKKIENQIAALCVYLSARKYNSNLYFAGIAEKKDRSTVMDILSKNRFVEFKTDRMIMFMKDRDAHRIEKNKLESARKELEKIIEREQNFLQTASDCNEYIRILKEKSKALSTGFTVYLSVWVESSRAGSIIEKISASVGAKVIISVNEAECFIGRKGILYENIPSKLGSAGIFEPFKNIVSVYGHPAYGHIDPTIFTAFSFLVMFGIMFADAGHGLVFFAAGLIFLLVRRTGLLSTLGRLFILAGISSVFFGFVFGSFFGHEDVIHPLLFSPMQNTMSFLLVGILVGIIIVSAGIFLNVVQKILQKNIAEAIFSQWGILSLGFYWLCLYLVYHSYVNGFESSTIPVIISAISVPLTLMIVGDTIREIKHGGEDISEIVFKPIEMILGLLSNTISFVRVAAFGLTHVALMTSVYLVASMGGDNPVMRISTSIEGNILVIILEGMVVSIQCLRLEFYEFYSKFFSLNGRRFKPLALLKKAGGL